MFICTFLDILIKYFGEVMTPTPSHNFDVVHQLLKEIPDVGRYLSRCWTWW